LYDDIVLALRDGWGDSQFKYWVRKNFKLITNGNEHAVYEIESNLPIVTHENLYAKIKECHEKDGHRGRDKTWIAVCQTQNTSILLHKISQFCFFFCFR
jgi:hypothetical protein